MFALFQIFAVITATSVLNGYGKVLSLKYKPTSPDSWLPLLNLNVSVLNRYLWRAQAAVLIPNHNQTGTGSGACQAGGAGFLHQGKSVVTSHLMMLGTSHEARQVIILQLIILMCRDYEGYESETIIYNTTAEWTPLAACEILLRIQDRNSCLLSLQQYASLLPFSFSLHVSDFTHPPIIEWKTLENP